MIIVFALKLWIMIPRLLIFIVVLVLYKFILLSVVLNCIIESLLLINFRML